MRTLRHVDMVKTRINSNVRLGKKSHLSDFERGMAAGARRAGLECFREYFWDFLHRHFLVVSENGPKQTSE